MLAASLQRVVGAGKKPHPRNKELRPPLKSILHGKHIFVVDDNAVNLKVAAFALKKYGATVECAESGKIAVAKLKPPHKYDACFMDIQMPEMDGFEATKKIREMEDSLNRQIQKGEVSEEDYGGIEHWHIPILAMTADVIQATYEECSRAGMDGYVSKPFEESQLYAEVARFFQS